MYDYLKSICGLTFKIFNLVPIHKHNFALFCTMIDHFYSISFGSPLNDSLLALYFQQDSDFAAKAESILSFGISFIKGLLDNPALWESDLPYSDRDPESSSQAEDYLENTFFTGERIQHILTVIVTKYLILTKEEIELWRDESLKFFLYMKYQSNEVKGNLLRERSKNLIAGI